MTTVYLIRHAQADGNIFRRCHGWVNGLITEKGREQMELLAARFQDIHLDAVYSSDLYRAMTTATALLKTHNLRLRPDPGLREMGAGVREDHTWGEWAYQDLENLEAFLRCDADWQVSGSETFRSLQERVCGTVLRIAAGHPNQTIAMVSHGCAIRTAVSAWRGVSIDEIGTTPLGENTCVAKLEIEEGSQQVRLVYFNDSSHLGPKPEPDASAAKLLPGAQTMLKTVVRFVPLSFPRDTHLYLNARRDGWLCSHGTMEGYQDDDFLETAVRNSLRAPESVLGAWLDDTFAGILQMDFDQDADQQAGRVPFLYMAPDARGKKLGVQLVGQAVCQFRKLGRRVLRLRCAPENDHAQRFYAAQGFRKVGEVPGGTGTLDLLEKYIGLEI